jgi:hypothetical protein
MNSINIQGLVVEIRAREHQGELRDSSPAARLMQGELTQSKLASSF